MLQFFRRYQKFFFIFVTCLIVFSFLFFGTFSTLGNQQPQMPNPKIGELVDGTPLKERDLQGLIFLLSHGVEEGGRTMGTVNLLNDSLVHKEFILSGLGQIIADHYFEKLAPELQIRWKRAKQFIPYTHPYASSISARAVWGQFCPQINALLDELKKAPAEFSKENLSLLFKLYEAQVDLPPQMLYQILYFQQTQNKQIRPDPAFPQTNVALFGFESIEDWFGSPFMEIVAQVILNGAVLAKEEGYLVTKAEAQVDLLSNIYQGMKGYSQGKNPANEDVQKYFFQKIRSIGLEEATAVGLWQQVMLCRRFYQEVGEAVFLDSLALEQFTNFAKSSYKICRFELPSFLQFADFRSLLKFQKYLEIVSEGDMMDLPTHFSSFDSLIADHPELVYKSFAVEIASIDRTAAAAKVGLKQTWGWEVKKENFVLLQQEFPFLFTKKGETEEKRLALLEELDPETRFKVDQFAREALVRENPEWIETLLIKAPREKQTIKVSPKKGKNPFSGSDFLELLENQAAALSHYTVDGERFYSITVLENNDQWELLSFEEANEDGTLDDLLDTTLLAAYSSFKKDKPFEQVKDEIGAKLYKDLLKSIEKQSEEKISGLQGYAQHRFDSYLQKMQTLAIQNPEAFAQIEKESPWPLVQREEQMPKKEDISLAVGEFSPVENHSFFQLLEIVEGKPSEADLAAAKEPLKKDAQKKWMTSLLQKLDEAQVIK